jgi:hypothetical protein
MEKCVVSGITFNKENITFEERADARVKREERKESQFITALCALTFMQHLSLF